MTAHQRVTHGQMVAWWRQGRATTVSAEVLGYAWCHGAWWRRLGPVWERIPDGPFALALSAGRARYEQACCDTGRGEAAAPRRDPWAASRNRRRGAGCGRRATPAPMFAVEPRPRQPIVCPARAPR